MIINGYDKVFVNGCDITSPVEFNNVSKINISNCYFHDMSRLSECTLSLYGTSKETPIVYIDNTRFERISRVFSGDSAFSDFVGFSAIFTANQNSIVRKRIPCILSYTNCRFLDIHVDTKSYGI